MICTSLKRRGSDDALGAVRAKGHAWGPRTSAICTIALALALPTGVGALEAPRDDAGWERYRDPEVRGPEQRRRRSTVRLPTFLRDQSKIAVYVLTTDGEPARAELEVRRGPWRNLSRAFLSSLTARLSHAVVFASHGSANALDRQANRPQDRGLTRISRRPRRSSS